MCKILIVDDEHKAREVIEAYLKQAKFTVLVAETGQQALELYKTHHPDLIILDLMLPDIPGEEICSIIRSDSKIPILMLTAKSHEEDRISGIAMGADDYLVKPFSPRELVVRVRGLLRRTSDWRGPLADIIRLGRDNLVIDTMNRNITKRGKVVELTPIEYKLLLLLAGNPGRVFTRDTLVDQVLGFDYDGYDRTIDAHIKNLRQKIEDNPRQPQYIKTVFGMGYKFQGDVL